MTDTEKAALCARIDELCAEVEYDRQTSRSRLERIDQLKAENERLRQENQSIGMAAYEIGYRNGSIHYELEHCPACKNVADLQEALEENAKLLRLLRALALCADDNADCDKCVMNGAVYSSVRQTFCDGMADELRAVGIEVD